MLAEVEGRELVRGPLSLEEWLPIFGEGVSGGVGSEARGDGSPPACVSRCGERLRLWNSTRLLPNPAAMAALVVIAGFVHVEGGRNMATARG